MRPELREIIWHNWCQPMTAEHGRRLTFAADVHALDSESFDELIAMYTATFPRAAGLVPEHRELEQFLHALMLVEYRLDSVELLLPQMRSAAWRSAAAEVGWPVDRLLDAAHWCRAAGLRRPARLA